MGRGMAGLEAAALVDGDIDQNRAGPHTLDHLVGHQLGGRGTRHQHGADHQIGVDDQPLDGVDRRKFGGELGAEDLVQLAQAIDGAVDHRDIGLHAHGHARGMGAGDAAADDHHLRRRDAGDAAQKDAGTRPAPFSRQWAPTWIDMRPATSLMGASSGRPPRGLVTVS